MAAQAATKHEMETILQKRGLSIAGSARKRGRATPEGRGSRSNESWRGVKIAAGSRLQEGPGPDVLVSSALPSSGGRAEAAKGQ